MDRTQIAAALRAEIARLQQALALIEGISGAKRRGRPPRGMQPTPVNERSRARKPFSEATKRKMAASQKRRWAAKKKAATKD